MADTESGNLLLQRDFGINLQRVGNVILRLGKSEAVLQYLGKASKVLKGLVDADPRNAEVQHDLGVCYERLGDTV